MKISDKIIEYLKSEMPSVLGIYIFGSYDTKAFSQNSDIDIAVLSKDKYDTNHLWDISQKLAGVLKRDIDLVDINKASTVFKYEIIKTGNLIFSQNQQEIDQFENRTMSEYLKLNEERKEILKDISKKGVF